MKGHREAHLILSIQYDFGQKIFDGFFQYVFGTDFIPQGAIPGGTFSNRNVAAQFIVMNWPLSFLLFLLQKDRKKYWLSAFLYSIILIFLLYTRTRAAWVSLLSSILILVLFLLVTGFWKTLGSFIHRGKLLVFLIRLQIHL